MESETSESTSAAGSRGGLKTGDDLATAIAAINELLDQADQPERGAGWNDDFDPEDEAQTKLREIYRAHHYETEGDRPVGTASCGSAGFKNTPVALYRLLYLFAPKVGGPPWTPKKPLDFGDIYKSQSLFAICSPDYHFHADPQFYKYEIALYLSASKEHTAGREHGVICGVPGSDNGIQAASQLLRDWWALLLRCLNREWNVYPGNNFRV